MEQPALKKPTARTGISVAKSDEVIVRGYPLTELMGNVSFADAAYLLLSGKLPNKAQSRTFNALLVSLIDHGIATQSIAARWVIRSAPEAIQGAMSAAIQGIGDQFGGVAEKVGEMLANGMQMVERQGVASDEVARTIVKDYLARGKKIPGLGHTIHRGGDPRTKRLLEVASKSGFSGKHVELLERIRVQLESITKRVLVINAMGAVGAVTLDLGLDWHIAKGLMVVSKSPGILAHLAEELKTPIHDTLSECIHEKVQYDGPLGKHLSEQYLDMKVPE